MMQQPPNWQPAQSSPVWPNNQAPFQTPPPTFSPPQPQPPQPKPRVPAWLKYGLIIVICLAIGYGMGFTAGNVTSVRTANLAAVNATAAAQPTSAPQRQPTRVPQPTAKPTQAPTWKTLQTFSGNGNKKTPIFSASTNWRMNWTCHGFPDGIDGAFAVSVDNADGSFLDVAAINATCKGSGPTSDTTNEHQGGSVYLDINATGDWSITVQEYQ